MCGRDDAHVDAHRLIRAQRVDQSLLQDTQELGLSEEREFGDLVEGVGAQVIQRPSAEWIDRLREADIPCTIVQDYEAIREDPQAIANGYVHETEHPKWGSLAIHGPVALFSETPASIRTHAPERPGEHSVAILQEGGFSEQEVSALVQAEVVLTPSDD